MNLSNKALRYEWCERWSVTRSVSSSSRNLNYSPALLYASLILKKTPLGSNGTCDSSRLDPTRAARRPPSPIFAGVRRVVGGWRWTTKGAFANEKKKKKKKSDDKGTRRVLALPSSLPPAFVKNYRARLRQGKSNTERMCACVCASVYQSENGWRGARMSPSGGRVNKRSGKWGGRRWRTGKVEKFEKCKLLLLPLPFFGGVHPSRECRRYKRRGIGGKRRRERAAARALYNIKLSY